MRNGLDKVGGDAAVRRRARRRLGWKGVAVAALAVGLGSLPAATLPAGAAPEGSGPVDVLYAGSLVTLMQTTLGPAFTHATGFSVTGISGGSSALAEEIKGGIHQADVFVSASPAVDSSLEGTTNGTWVSWDITFATSPLLLAYNPHSDFAATLRHKPWWKVVTKPGFRLGRTNPATDPKGALAVTALEYAANAYDEPALAALTTQTATVFPEQTLVGRLQAGQLDAGFFYGVEASAAHLKTVPLTGIALHATYTVTVVAKAPHEAAAEAFVTYLLSQKARSIMKRNGLTPVVPPTLSGTKAELPRSVQRALR